MAHTELLLAFDIGTTSVKGAIYTLEGKCLLRRSESYRKFSPQQGWAEQNPQDWLDCMEAILARIGSEYNAGAIRGMGICSQVNTHVFVDEKGHSLMPAIVWDDQRCAEVADELNGRIERENFVDTPTQDSSSLAARAEWVRRHWPEVWERTHAILSPKDYCILQLTGERVTDTLSSIGLVDEEGEYLPGVLELVTGLAQRLPPIKPICQVAGAVRDNRFSSVNECPLVVGTMDAWANLFGSGAFSHGGGYQVAGTSEIIGLVSQEKCAAEGVVTFPRYQGLYLHAGPTQAGGDALRWFAATQEKPIADLLKAAQPAFAEPLIFLPYLMGERAPIWDSSARGAFIGLSKNHDRSAMTRAVLEGVAFSARHLLEHLEQAAGFRSDKLIISGGASVSDLWCRIKADVMNRTLCRVENIDTGIFGAALMAAVGVGLYTNLDEAVKQGVVIDRYFEPDENQQDRYEGLYRVYRESYYKLRPIYGQLEGLG